MKNLVIGLCALGLTSLGFSQDTHEETTEIRLEGVVITNRNFGYLEKVQDITLPEQVKSLEKEASIFNVKDLVEFDGRKKSFRVLFKGTRGYIIADYDRNGKILKTIERYRDIALPKNLIKAVLKQYPDSKFLKVVYSVDYDTNKTVEKAYKIQIMSDGKKMNLKKFSGGNLNYALPVNSME